MPRTGPRPLNPEYATRLEPLKQYIRNYWAAKHFAPSLGDVAKHFKISNSVANYQLRALEKFGWLEPRQPREAHNIVPVEIFKDRPVFRE